MQNSSMCASQNKVLSFFRAWLRLRLKPSAARNQFEHEKDATKRAKRRKSPMQKKSSAQRMAQDVYDSCIIAQHSAAAFTARGTYSIHDAQPVKCDKLIVAPSIRDF